MKRYLISIIITAAAATTHAETFEHVIERQPPETEKTLSGITELVMNKTGDIINGLNGVLTGISEGDLKSALESFEKSTDTFKKFRTSHKEALQKQLLTKENKVATLATKGTADAELANAYIDLGRAAIDAGDFAKARDAFAEALQIAETITDASRTLQFDALLAMADCAYEFYDTDYMLHVRNKLESLTANDNFGTINQRVKTHLASGRCDLRLGNTTGAIHELDHALNLANSDSNFDHTDPAYHKLKIEVLKKLPDLGLTTLCLEHLNKYIDEILPVLGVLNHEVLAEIYIVSADCNSRLNNHSTAFDKIIKARDIIQSANPNGSISELEYLITLGDILRRNSLDKNNGISNAYTDKGALHYLNGCRLLAKRIWGDEKQSINPWLRRINSKLALTAVVDYHINTANSRNYTPPTVIKSAEVAANKASYTDSEANYIRYNKLADQSLKFARKLYKTELDYMREKISADFLSMDESQRADYMAAMSELVNDIYNFAELDKTDKECAGMVYNATLLSKSVLLSFSRSLGTSIKAMNDPALTAQLDELNAMRRDYVRLEQNGDFASSAAIRRKANELELTLQRAVSPTEPGAFMATTWNDVKSNLNKNDAAVEFYTFTDNLSGDTRIRERIVAIASNKNPHVFAIPHRPGELKLAEEWQRKSLYAAVWQPLEKDKYLKAGGTVYFSPAGRWNGIPLEYLPTGKEGMNERYTMVRVSTTRNRPSATVPVFDNPVLFGGLDYNIDIDDMAAIRDEIADTGLRGPLASGLWNHLPGTEEEVNEIASILSESPNTCTLVTGAEGIEESFKSLSGQNHGIVHIATHGYYYQPDNKPGLRSESVKMDEAMDNSGLVFAGANQYLAGIRGEDGLDNGLLTAREIALMDLSSTDLVVMSACDTGAGRATSEGVLGLQRGFKLAGVNTLVMSLWKVNDRATAAMMSAFYRHLTSGKDKRSAFYAARAELRKGTFKNAEGKDVPGTDPLIGDAFVIMD